MKTLQAQRAEAWQRMVAAAHSGDDATWLSASILFQHLTERLRNVPERRSNR